MTKWADFLISAVRFEETKTSKHISQVKIHVDKGDDKLGVGFTATRKEVVDYLNSGKKITTIYYRRDAQLWALGEEVFVVKINNVEYIKTKSDNTTKDNLDNLPTF